MTLAELGAAGVPSVLVPYPYAAEDHQTLNARRYAAGGAAVVVDQSRLTPAGLAELVQEIVADPERRRTMSEAARRTEGAGARERIAKACEAYLPRG
jgi:UDP-N-acetylglucosamine--N-acetylmuramyl-(pentapeptide) pyrophosphoryl-undecaprenol N-acetylglucosamine transferase